MSPKSNSQQIQYLLQNWIQALRFLFYILEEFLSEQWEILAITEDKMKVLTRQNPYQVAELSEQSVLSDSKFDTNDNGSMNHNGMEFKVYSKKTRTYMHVVFRYDRSFQNLPHINIVLSSLNSRKNIVLNAAIYWNQDSTTVLHRLSQLINFMFKRRPRVNQTGSLEKFLNIPSGYLKVIKSQPKNNCQDNQHYKEQFENAYKKKMQKLEDQEMQQQIQQLQKLFTKLKNKDKQNINKTLIVKLKQILSKVQKARRNVMQWLKKFYQLIVKLINKQRASCNRPQKQYGNRKDDDDNQNFKNEKKDKIQRLQAIRNTVNYTINQRKNTPDNHKPTQGQTKKKNHNINDILDKIIEIRLKAKLLLDQKRDNEEIIKRRRDFTAKLRKLANQITNVVQGAGKIQAVAGGFTIGGGLAMLAGAVYAPLKVGYYLMAGGATAAAISGGVILISEYHKDSELRRIFQDIEQQVEKMKNDHNTLNSFVEELRQKIANLVQQLKQNKSCFQNKLRDIELMESKLISGLSISILAFFISNKTQLAVKSANVVGLGQLTRLLSSVGGFVCIGLGVWEMVQGIKKLDTIPENAITVQTIALDIDLATNRYQKAFKSMVKLAQLVQQ